MVYIFYITKKTKKINQHHSKQKLYKYIRVGLGVGHPVGRGEGFGVGLHVGYGVGFGVGQPVGLGLGLGVGRHVG